MEKKNISLTFCAKIVPFEKINDQFTRCKCYVMALGKNRNLTYFSKENVEKALPTIFNVPVIGHIVEAEDGHKYMGGHDVEVVVDEKGNLSLRSLCVPYGVVPQQDNLKYETLIEPDGVAREYLAADIILWTGRYPELKEVIYSDNVYFNQSMEIVANSWKPLDEDHNYLDVVEFMYSALCLLGKADDKTSAEHTEPCFPLATVQPYEYNLKSDSFVEMVSQLREELASCFSQIESQEGGNAKKMTKEMFDAILQEFNLTAEEAGIEMTDEMTEETLRASLQEFIEQNAGNTDNAVDDDDASSGDVSFTDESANDNGAEDIDESFSLTANERSEMLAAALQNASGHTTDDEGRIVSETYYYLADFDDEYVYCTAYTYHRDDGESHMYCRAAYAIDQHSRTASLTGGFEEMVAKWLTIAEAEELDRQRREYEELLAYRSNKEEEELHNAMDAVLSEFSDIENAEEFAEIRKDPYKFSTVDALRVACFAVRGMVNQPKTRNGSECRQPISVEQFSDTSNDRYGDLFSRFGRKHN